MARWLSENTDIVPSQVVIAGPDRAYSLQPLGPRTATDEVIAFVRAEPLATDVESANGVQSWEAHLLFDCAAGRLKQIRAATYKERNRKGSAVAQTTREGWIVPEANQPAMQLLAAACDPNFVWPLRPGLTEAAAPPAPAPLPPDVQVSASTTRARPPAAAAAAPSPPVRTGFAVQIARGPSEEGARKALAKARTTLGAKGEGLTPLTETAQAGTRRRYVAVLAGFPTGQAAAEACRTLMSAGQTCFTREAAKPAAETAVAQSAAAPSDARPAQIAAAPSKPDASGDAPPNQHVVQIARGPSQAGAKKALATALKALGPLADGTTATTEESSVGSRRRYTAVLAGFSTAAAAAEACDTLHKAGQSCFARRPKAAADAGGGGNP